MFNVASKILFLIVDPPALIFILLVCAWIARRRKAKIFLGTYIAAIVILFALACPTISGWMLKSLEDQNADRDVTSEPSAQAIVVLGGSINMPSQLHHASGITNSSDRLLMALRLYHAGKAPLIVVSGGDSPLLAKGRSLHEGDEMRNLLVEWGIPNSAILVEDRSVNTRENALFTHQLLEPKGIGRIILVSSAIHMPRAGATFRKVGFEVVAAPADFRTGWEEQIPVFNWMPASSALANSSEVMHEWLGLWVYRIEGWT